MDSRKQKTIKKMGGRVTTVQEFLGLSDEDSAVIEARLVLARGVREQRAHAGMTQMQLAKSIKSSQSRVAKMEGGDPQASLESMIRALAAVGSTVTIKVVRAPTPRKKIAARVLKAR